jgi:hypothetical protein
MLWLCEAIRQKEGTGSIDDTEVVALMGRDNGLRDATNEELVFQRADRLTLANAVVSALPKNIDIVFAYAGYAFIGLCFLALILGASAAASAFSRTTINIAFVFLALLGPHLLSLFWMVLLLFFGSRSGRLSLANGWLWLSERIGRRHDGVFLVESLRTLVSRADSLPWLLMGISHFLWLLFALSSIGFVLIFLGVEEYAFVWKTTTWSRQFFVRAVEITGWAPALIGFSVPSSDDVATLKNVDSVRKAWAGWLLGSLWVYGVMPRLLLLGVSYWTAISRLRVLALDFSNPHYVVLLQRIRNAFTPLHDIVDPDPGNVEPTGRELPSLPGSPSVQPINAIIPYELRDPALLASIATGNHLTLFENVVDHDSQSSTLTRIRSQSIQRIIFACDSRNTADRGAFQFLRLLKSLCPEVRVVLMHRDSAPRDKVANWIAGFNEIGFAESEVVSELSSLADWMGASNL